MDIPEIAYIKREGKPGHRLKQEKNHQDVKKLVEAVDDNSDDDDDDDDDDVDEMEDDVSDAVENDDSDEEGKGHNDDSEIEGDGDEKCEMAEKDVEDECGVDAKEGDDEEDKEANEEDVKIAKKRKLLSPKHGTKIAKLETQKPKDRATLYIKTNSVDVESSAIEKFFRDHQIGVIEIRRIQGKSFAYADVPADQTEAALKLSCYKMAGKEVEIQIAREKASQLTNKTSTEKNASKDSSQKKSLFVKNLPYDLSDDDIKSHFPLALNVSAKRKPNGKLLGYAFLDFESEEVAEKVISELQNSQINGRTVALDFVGGKRMNTTPQLRPDESCKTLCVKQLSYSISKEELKTAFKNAADVRIVADPDNGKPKGFAFVSFNSHEDASNAMEKMQGKLLKGRNLAISFSRKASDGLSEDVAFKDKGKKKKKKQNEKRHKGRRLKKSTEKSDST